MNRLNLTHSIKIRSSDEDCYDCRTNNLIRACGFINYKGRKYDSDEWYDTIDVPVSKHYC